MYTVFKQHFRKTAIQNNCLLIYSYALFTGLSVSSQLIDCLHLLCFVGAKKSYIHFCNPHDLIEDSRFDLCKQYDDSRASSVISPSSASAGHIWTCVSDLYDSLYKSESHTKTLIKN